MPDERTRRSTVTIWLLATALALSAGPPLLLAQGKASVNCEIKENGESATGTLLVRRDAQEVARGSCGKPLAVPAGTYTAVLSLDGALDGPQQERPLTVEPGNVAQIAADFPTGIVEVRIQREGRRAAGMAVIRRGGKQIGTLGSGVAAHLSTGTYEVVARYRTQEKRFEQVTIARGQRVVLDASFD